MKEEEVRYHYFLVEDKSGVYIDNNELRMPADYNGLIYGVIINDYNVEVKTISAETAQIVQIDTYTYAYAGKQINDILIRDYHVLVCCNRNSILGVINEMTNIILSNFNHDPYRMYNISIRTLIDSILPEQYCEVNRGKLACKISAPSDLLYIPSEIKNDYFWTELTMWNDTYIKYMPKSLIVKCMPRLLNKQNKNTEKIVFEFMNKNRDIINTDLIISILDGNNTPTYIVNLLKESTVLNKRAHNMILNIINELGEFNNIVKVSSATVSYPVNYGETEKFIIKADYNTYNNNMYYSDILQNKSVMKTCRKLIKNKFSKYKSEIHITRVKCIYHNKYLEVQCTNKGNVTPLINSDYRDSHIIDTTYVPFFPYNEEIFEDTYDNTSLCDMYDNPIYDSYTTEELVYGY